MEELLGHSKTIFSDCERGSNDVHKITKLYTKFY